MSDQKIDLLFQLAAEIATRRTVAPDLSYTAKLLADGTEACAKKMGEEAIETALAAMTEDRPHFVSEAADLLYHLLVLLEVKRVPLPEVISELSRRQGISGHVEKAARPGN